MIDFDTYRLLYQEFRRTHKLPEIDVLRGNLEGDKVLTYHTVLKGKLLGNLTVTSGVTLILNGELIGTLFVKPGGTAIVKGVIQGNIHGYNMTLRLKKSAVVYGNLFAEEVLEPNDTISERILSNLEPASDLQGELRLNSF